MKWDYIGEEHWRRRSGSEVKPVSEGVLTSFESMGISSSNDISSVSTFATESADPPSSLVGGRNRQSAAFSATFKMDQVGYREFPFEEFYLPIVVTTDYPTHVIVFADDERDSLVSDRVGLSGYRFVGHKSRNIFYRANTSWGYEARDGLDKS